MRTAFQMFLDSKKNLDTTTRDNCYVSLPVLRFERGRGYLAYYIAPFLDRDHTQTSRPTDYVLVDIKSGGSVKRSCAVDDFVKHNPKSMYKADVVRPRGYTDDTMSLYYKEMYEQLNITVNMYLEFDSPDKYIPFESSYINKLAALVNEDQKMFYSDLRIKQDAVVGKYTIKDVKWEPEKGQLDKIPERYYNFYKTVANYINFLPIDDPGEIRFEYPIVCNPQPSIDRSIDLVRRLEEGKVTKWGRYTIPSKMNLGIKCESGNCTFKACPYVTAAYIKYLDIVSPDELEKQRYTYKADRTAIDKARIKRISLDLALPEKFDEAIRDAMPEARTIVNSGGYSLEEDPSTNRYTVTLYMKKAAGNPMVKTCIFAKDTLEANLPGNFNVPQIDGKPSTAAMGMLILVDYLERKGLYDRYASADPWISHPTEIKNEVEDIPIETIKTEQSSTNNSDQVVPEESYKDDTKASTEDALNVTTVIDDSDLAVTQLLEAAPDVQSLNDPPASKTGKELESTEEENSDVQEEVHEYCTLITADNNDYFENMLSDSGYTCCDITEVSTHLTESNSQSVVITGMMKLINLQRREKNVGLTLTEYSLLTDVLKFLRTYDSNRTVGLAFESEKDMNTFYQRNPDIKMLYGRAVYDAVPSVESIIADAMGKMPIDIQDKFAKDLSELNYSGSEIRNIANASSFLSDVYFREGREGLLSIGFLDKPETKEEKKEERKRK